MKLYPDHELIYDWAVSVVGTWNVKGSNARLMMEWLATG
jgi:hypothetical protein